MSPLPRDRMHLYLGAANGRFDQYDAKVAALCEELGFENLDILEPRNRRFRS